MAVKKMNAEVTDGDGKKINRNEGKQVEQPAPKALHDMTKEELDGLQQEIGAMIAESNRLRAENNKLKSYIEGANAALNDKSATVNIEYCNMLLRVVSNSTVFDAYDKSELVETAMDKLAGLINPPEEEEATNGNSNEE